MPDFNVEISVQNADGAQIVIFGAFIAVLIVLWAIVADEFDLRGPRG